MLLYPSMAMLMLTLILSALSLSAGAAADPEDVGMPGCITSCGELEVPYPFGVGPSADCYLPGFNLTCDTSHDPPQLLLGTLRVHYFGLLSHFVSVFHTALMPMSGANSNSLQGDGTLLSGLRDDGPYRLSGSNELVLTGCNVQATLKKSNITLSGCSSFCDIHDGSLEMIDAECVGMGCCSERIMDYDGKSLNSAASYDVQVQWFGWNRSMDQQWPARVYLAVGGWSRNRSLSEMLFHDDHPGSMVVPIVLDWEVVQLALADNMTLGCSSVCKSNHSLCTKGRGYTCECEEGYDGNPYLTGGCTDVDECKRYSKEELGCFGECKNTQGSMECQCPPGTHGNPAIPGGCLNSTVLTRAGSCITSCGGVEVPYPFGMGASSCYWPGLNLTCDTSHQPPRLLLGNDHAFQVNNISLHDSTVRVIYSGAFINATSPYSSTSFSFDNSFQNRGHAPYSLSILNELIVMGCNAQAQLLGDSNPAIISGCASFCSNVNNNDSHVQGTASPKDKYCYGMGCCQSRISMSMDGLLPSALKFDWLDEMNMMLPVYVFIAEEGWFGRQKLFDKMLPMIQPSSSQADLDIPILLRWEVMHGLPKFDAKSHPNCSWEVSQKLCKSKHSYCIAGSKGYTCHCMESYDGNPYSPHEDGCKGGYGKPLTRGIYIAIGVAIGAGVILSVLSVLFISNKLKHRREETMKRKFFHQNRGRLLQQLVSHRADIAERMIISLEELEKATNNFDKSRVLGGGGHGTVYKGILSDLHVVAIKKTKKVVQKEIDEFINEVAILSQINHRNVVKLYGCCLETEVPMLVYEFISNGTLYDHLHIQGPSSLSWDNRLRIATETAGSLSYLHSTACVPIIHRDVKSNNILLDESLTSKVADFGASKFVPVERSGVTTIVQGTRGYLDPMYFYTGRLTEKSDVYSFGVMLVELLTREKPYAYLSSGGEGLVVDFVTLFAAGNLSQILDRQIMEEGGEEIDKVAALAVECIKLRGEDRPTMKQVESTLSSLQTGKHQVLGTAGVDTHENGTAIPYPEIEDPYDESTRPRSMEEEFILSSRYPR